MLTKEELEESRITSMKVCEQSYLMYENSKREIVEVAAKKTDKNGAPLYTEQAIKKNLQLIETAQQDVIDQYIQMGGTLEDLQKLKSPKKKTVDKKHLQELMKKETERDELLKYITNLRAHDVTTKQTENIQEKPAEPVVQEVTNTQTNSPYMSMEELQEKLKQVSKEHEAPEETERLNSVMPQIVNIGEPCKMYDYVKLPSKGQCYRHKKDKVRVAYLTAFDENMILSPSLYKDGKFIDFLLKAKVYDDDINPEELTKGDRDAIVLWLRATGYGNDYPIVVTDEDTGRDFDTNVDLSTLNYKPFKLKSDINGYFDFQLPNTGDVIKFKFLTVADLNVLEQLKLKENKKMNVLNIRQVCSELMDAVRNNELVSTVAQQKIKNAVEFVRDEIAKNYDEENDFTFSHELTDRLLLQTVSINGITDRKYIENYIFSMNVKDAASYRKYIIDNEPGVDFNIEVERPESLGGGSIKSFLRLDQFIFVNF